MTWELVFALFAIAIVLGFVLAQVRKRRPGGG
jgi:hypothetical protein